MVQQQTSNFNWVSNSVYEHYDPVQGNKLYVCLDTGINDSNQFFSPVPLRISLKIKSSKTNQTISIEFSFHDIFNLCVETKNMFSSKIQTLEIESFFKNTKTILKIVKKQDKYILKISDINDNSLMTIFDKFHFVTFSNILVQLRNNWVSNSVNLQTTLSNYRLIQDFDKLKSSMYINTITSNQTSNELPVVPIDNKIKDEEVITKPKKEKIIKLIRPVFNNFLNWDLEHLHKWATAFVVIDEKTRDLSFKPFELILYNSGCFKTFMEFQKSKDYLNFQFFIINNLKKSILNSIDSENFRFERVDKIFKFNDLKQFNSDDEEFWDFTVDLVLLQNIYKLFLYSFKNVENVDNSVLYEIKLTELFLSLITTTLIKLIDENYLNDFKNDVQKLFIKMIEDGKINLFEPLKNTYNYATAGGKFEMNTKSFGLFLDKYIDTISKINDFYENEHKINSFEDLKLIILPKKEKIIDKKLKLFIKVLKTESSYNDKFDNIDNFNDLENVLESDFEIKLFNLLKFEDEEQLPKLTSIIRSLNYTEENNDEDNYSNNKVSFEVDETISEINQSEKEQPKSLVQDIFTIEDNDIENFNPFS